MGKELVPRFKCPMCGWLAYYSMLEKGPHKLEVVGMKYGGFQEISYHKIRGMKKEYKEFLRVKVRELAKELGIKLADEEEITADEEEYEYMEAEPSEEILVEKPLGRVIEIPIERVKSVPVEYADHGPQQWTARKPSYKEFLSTYAKVIEKDHVVMADAEDQDSYIRTEDTEFIDLGDDK